MDYAGRGGYIIYISGSVGNGSVNDNNRVRVASNTTLYGLPGSVINAWVTVSNGANVILRNLTIIGPGSIDVDGQDALNVSGATNVWVDHCDISDGQDGNFDIINQANYITVSWTRFSYSSRSTDHQYSNLIGNSDSKTGDRGHLKTTLYYNWWDNGVKERMPRVRFGEVHVVNNLFSSNASSTCVRAGIEANLLIESNAFIGVKKPIDLYNGDYTAVSQRNNIFTGTSGNTSGNGTAFSPPYSMPIVSASEVEAKVRACTGATLGDPR
jgi:pectate lyase